MPSKPSKEPPVSVGGHARSGRAYKHDCLIPDCPNEGFHALTLRMRRPNTSAIWAPTTGAYLCDDHAVEGCDIRIEVTPKPGGIVGVWTIGIAGTKRGIPATNSVEIKQGPNR